MYLKYFYKLLCDQSLALFFQWDKYTKRPNLQEQYLKQFFFVFQQVSFEVFKKFHNKTIYINPLEISFNLLVSLVDM